jgi:ZIP family zinc transporter
MEKFMYGQSSALVEPIAAVLGALQLHFSPNFTLCFAAGAMIFVVVEEVIQRRNRIIIRTSPMGFVGIYCYDGLGCCSWVGIVVWDY